MAHWLVTGGSGLLGHALAVKLVNSGHQVSVLVNSNKSLIPEVRQIKIDITDQAALMELAHQAQPDVIVHSAGLTNVDACEENEKLAVCLHVTCAEALAAYAHSNSASFFYISTDHLWDGTQSFMKEDTPVAPINAYARSKVAGEQGVLKRCDKARVLRTNFFGKGMPWRKSIWGWMIEKLQAGESLPAFTDAYFTPIGLPILANYIIRLEEIGFSGICHVAGCERLSKYEFAKKIAHHYGFDMDLVIQSSLEDQKFMAPRPRDLSLSTDLLSNLFDASPPSVLESLLAVDKFFDSYS